MTYRGVASDIRPLGAGRPIKARLMRAGRRSPSVRRYGHGLIATNVSDDMLLHASRVDAAIALCIKHQRAWGRHWLD